MQEMVRYDWAFHLETRLHLRNAQQPHNALFQSYPHQGNAPQSFKTSVYIICLRLIFPSVLGESETSLCPVSTSTHKKMVQVCMPPFLRATPMSKQCSEVNHVILSQSLKSHKQWNNCGDHIIAEF